MTDKKNKKTPSFGRIMLASSVGALIALIVVGLFKLLIFFGIVGSFSKEATPKIADGSFLKIDLTSEVKERTPSDVEILFSNGNEAGFNDLLRSIDAAKEDSRIKGVYLYMGSTYALSWGMSAELRESLRHFSESGKPILAYADNYSPAAYFLGTAADSVYMNPSGLLQFNGIGAEAMFFKEMLDRLKVKMTLVRPKSNRYKSAGERYTMNQFSDANRQQVRDYLNSIWDYATEEISRSRNISQKELNEMADNLSACLPNDALEKKLIDRLCFESDIKATMEKKYKSKEMTDVSDYVKTIDKKNKVKERIAVIYAEGDVVAGSGYNTAVYSDNITEVLDSAANDETVKAIVLRVNSPGGQVTASEIMTDAVRRAKTKKPVIVSMGDVAASAGYEISCNADYIFAQPTTLTGSIGVFAAIPEVGGMMKHYLGITTDTVKTNTNSTALSLMRPMSPKTQELMQRNVEEFYTVFVDRVAKGRRLDYNFVDSIAHGRVWTGRDALSLGLVDELGGLDDAVKMAAKKANLKEYRVVDFPEQSDFFTEILHRRTAWNQAIQGSAVPRVSLPSKPKTIKHLYDGVWVSGNLVADILEHICETEGLQARVEFFLITE